MLAAKYVGFKSWLAKDTDSWLPTQGNKSAVEDS